MTLKVLHLSTYSGGGGAARAASNLNLALQQAGVNSEMVSAQGKRFKAARAADRALWKLQRSPIETWRSPARFGSLSAKEINDSGADIVNLHWVTDGFISIEGIGGIRKPVVWSMYDMWPFTGTEHYTPQVEHPRWVTGYSPLNRAPAESGVDLDAWTFGRKVQAWGQLATHATLVPPSRWLEQATNSSFLLSEWHQRRIPHAIVGSGMYPIPQREAREKLGLPQSMRLVLFLSSAGVDDHRKGFDLLREAMPERDPSGRQIGLVIVGPIPDDARRRQIVASLPISCFWVSPTQRADDLLRLYNATDVVAVPSREDNLPLTAIESLACGKPVVAFRVGGLPDIVEHKVTGFLAEPFRPDSLRQGVLHELASEDRGKDFASSARAVALATFSPKAVARQYLDVYDQLLAN